MTREDLLMFVRARPFHPFEIRTVSGERYPVKSPEVMISDTMIVISENG